VQSDGCFFVSLSKGKKYKFGLRIRPTFVITQDLSSISVLESVQKYFCCGIITIDKKRNAANFVVSSIKDIKEKIIPHFQLNPLHLAKQNAYLIFVE
jgi:LAGLIDADG endonuclease